MRSHARMLAVITAIVAGASGGLDAKEAFVDVEVAFRCEMEADAISFHARQLGRRSLPEIREGIALDTRRLDPASRKLVTKEVELEALEAERDERPVNAMAAAHRYLLECVTP